MFERRAEGVWCPSMCCTKNCVHTHIVYLCILIAYLYSYIVLHRCINTRDYTCDMCEYFFLDVSIIVYPIALIQSWWKTRSRTGSALAGGWWLSLQEAYLGRLGGAHLETKRWLGWISRRQLVLVCISFFFCNSSPQFPKLRPRCHTKVAPSERTRAPCNLVNTGTALSCWKLKGAESRETCYICALNSMGMTRPPLQSCSVFWNDLNLWLICVTGTHWNPGNHKASWQQHWSTWYVFLSVLRPFHPAWRCSLWRRPKKNPAMCLCWTGVGQGMARGSVWSVWTSVD